METLKCNNEKCGKEKVLHLSQESVDREVTEEKLEELLEKLVKYHSVQIKLVGTRTYLVGPTYFRKELSIQRITNNLMNH